MSDIVFALLMGIGGFLSDFISTSYKYVQVDDLEWQSPALLSIENCPNINGKYLDQGSLSARFVRLATNDDERQQNGLPKVHLSDSYGYRKIPDGNSFYKEATTSIERRESDGLFEVNLKDGEGLLYEKTLIDLDHRQVGCHNGAWVIKDIEISPRDSKGCGVAYTREEEYRKLEDGTLEITYHHREWPCQIDAGDPKITQGKLIFPPAQ